MTAKTISQVGGMLRRTLAAVVAVTLMLGPLGSINGEKETDDVLFLSYQDVIDIKKTATTEVVVTLKESAFRNQTDAVTDTILNRLKSGHWGTSVKEVVNAKNQFSAINGPRKLKPYGSVDRMPERAINTRVSAEVDRWLALRASGTPSSIGDNLNYLNPLYSSRRSLEEWGKEVVAQAKKSGLVMGSGKAKHYHGTAKGLQKYRPGEFRVILGD